jgi:hypothetical protein
MTTPSVTIRAAVNGALNKVTIIKTGPTTASVETQVWNAGVNPSGPASSDNTISLANCAASADGSVLSADGPGALWMTSKILITLTQGTPDQAEIAVTGVGPEDSDTKALISAADYAAVLAFIKAAAYPAVS